MKEKKTRIDYGVVAICDKCGALKGSVQFNDQITKEMATKHVRETEHRVHISKGNVVSLGDPDK